MEMQSSKQASGSSVSSAGAAIATTKGPGSNGYRQRKLFLKAGAYTWVAPFDGKIKGQVIGAGGGGGDRRCGASGGYSEFETQVSKGDILLITLGAGGEGKEIYVNGDDGGATTIVCAAAGINIAITGAGGGHSTVVPLGGVATGGDINFNGVDGLITQYSGGPSSANPRGNGFGTTFIGGCGWGGPSNNNTGSSSHRAGIAGVQGEIAANGLTAKGGTSFDTTYGYADPQGHSNPDWWDLEDLDGGGGAVAKWSGADGGLGAGGGGSIVGGGGNGGIGGGGGMGSGTSGVGKCGGDGGNGGGGGACATSFATLRGGKGGDGLFALYFNPES